MIRDLSETLRAILTQPGLPPELAAARIIFDRPSEPFSPEQTTVDLFLYDIRENVELRSNEHVIEHINGQTVIHRPPLRVACSYIVTAWQVGGTEQSLQEHRLLSQILRVLSRYPIIPAKFLQGSLIGQEPPLPMMTAQVNGLKDPAEFWTALGNRLRPSIIVTVTIAIDVFEPITAPIVITEEMRLGKRDDSGEEKIKPETLEKFFRIGGRVIDAEKKPVAKASVMLIELGLTTETDTNGRYCLDIIKSGAYTLQAQSANKKGQVSITVPGPQGSSYDIQITE